MNENKNVKGITELLRIVPIHLRTKLKDVLRGYEDKVQEIVLRSQRPVCIYISGNEYYLAQNGCLVSNLDSQELAIATSGDVTESFNVACGYSVYSHLSEIKNGFVTINGGHRVGVTGTAVVSTGEIVNIRDVSTISIRFSREIIGCGEKITSTLVNGGGGLLLCGSPCSGKTTVLRDIARLLSGRYRRRVSIVDTRGEIASSLRGVSQKDIAMCDVLDGYPRSQGIEQAVRTLSPDYVICDEIGSADDAASLISALNSGVNFVATFHAANREDLHGRNRAMDLLRTQAFREVVFLKGREAPGEIADVYNVEDLIHV